jgi:hypothetical protein
MTDQIERYREIAEACDQVLGSAEANVDWIAIPWLHFLSQHPMLTRNYEGLSENSFAWFTKGITRHQVALLIDLARSATAGKRAEFISTDTASVDVLIVSWLINVDHIEMKDDFYFGDLQARLARRGLSSLLALRNQTGHPTASLIERAKRTGPCSRLMLPDVYNFTEQFSFLLRSWRARRALGRVAQEQKSSLCAMAAQEARHHAVSHPTLVNLNLHAQMLDLCRRTLPAMVITLYEGHAWERCVWHAAKSVAPETLCVGYQHTILLKHAHAVKRSLNKNCDPDLVLTVGRVTRRMLESCDQLATIRFVTFGTHRYSSGPEHGLRTNSSVLVLPEGNARECFQLFKFALECAHRLPDVRFLFRTHPVFPFDRIRRKLLQPGKSLPPNVEISRSKRVEEDFARAGYLLYRGSSTVIYGVLAGLKPFYVSIAGEIEIDPLYELECWREHVDSVENFLDRYRTYGKQSTNSATAEWSTARDYCAGYAKPVDETAIDELLNHAKLTRAAHA